MVHSLSFNPSIVKSSRGVWLNRHASEGRHRVRRASKPSFQNTNHHELRKILLESQAKRKKSSMLDQSAINNEPGIIDVSKSSRNTSVLVGKQIILACQIPHEALGNESVRDTKQLKPFRPLKSIMPCLEEGLLKTDFQRHLPT